MKFKIKIKIKLKLVLLRIESEYKSFSYVQNLNWVKKKRRNFEHLFCDHLYLKGKECISYRFIWEKNLTSIIKISIWAILLWINLIFYLSVFVCIWCLYLLRRSDYDFSMKLKLSFSKVKNLTLKLKLRSSWRCKRWKKWLKIWDFEW